jgi:RND family efflux transporter MFP subunit
MMSRFSPLSSMVAQTPTPPKMVATRPIRCARLLLLLALAGASACSDKDAATGDSSRSRAGDSLAAAANDSGRPALPGAAESTREGDLVLLVRTTGQVRSDAVVKLRGEVAGTVAQLLVRPGQTVTQGQVLLRFDSYPFDLAVREAQASADEAEQRFFESFVPESLVTGRSPSLEQRKALMNKAGLTGARLRLERAKYEQDRAVVRAPMAGMVDAIDVATGEKVGAGQQLLTVVDTRNLRIEAQVLEHDMPLVRLGGEAEVTSAGAPGRVLRGRVDALLPLVDSTTRAGRAVVRVVGDGVLRPGMYADVQLEATRLKNRHLVPSRAVIERDGRPLVFVVREGRAQWTYIVPGRSNGRDTEVLPDSATGEIPVKAGDPVIVEGHLTLTHDAPVKVAPMAVAPGKPRG